MFGGNGGLFGFTISNPKYLEGLGGHGGLDPPLGSNGCPRKIMSTFLGISICMLPRSIPLGVWIQNLEMFNKSLPHIIFKKWTFIDLMSNLMTICAMWRVWSWNYVHTMNSSTPIPWDSYNNASTLLIKYGFTILYFDNHKYTFCYW
jgi:hypothetical protein